MEPADYLKILQRHWKVVAGLVVFLMVAVWFVSPKEPDPVYEARHTLLRDAASGDGGASSADNPAVVGLWATAGQVPQRVAEALGYDGPVDDLVNRVTVTPDVELGTVELVASAGTEDEAVVLVNTFAEQVLAFIDERAEAARQESEGEADALRQRIAELAPVITAGGQDAVTAQAEVDGITARLAELDGQVSTTRWVSLQVASGARQTDDAVVGATRSQRLLLAGLVSVLLAFGVAIMLDRSDSRLHTKEQVERHFDLPVLAEVPLLPLRSRHRAAVHGFESDPRVAEAYRSLRTALLLFRDRLPLEVEAAELSGRAGGRSGGQRQVIVVTSADAGDGKSSTSANLAMAYAEAGQSVLLVNWDLWRPMPARVLDAEDAPGVSEFLDVGNASLTRFVQATSVPGLHYVPAGKLGHQPRAQIDAELRLLEEARAMADVVIIDTAPLLAASVTRELVTMADVVVVAARAGRTTGPAADRTAELLGRLGAPTLGVVLVGVATGLFTDYYGNPPSRADRLRTTVMGRVEARDPAPRSPRRPPAGHGDDRGDLFRPSPGGPLRKPGP